MRKTLCAVVALLAACQPPHVYTAADRATFDAIAPEYLQYVETDAALAPKQKARRVLTVDTWRMRLEAAEVGR